MVTKSVELPDLPKETEFEEYVSACLQLGGYFLERNIQQQDVLELDATITDYDISPPCITLIEVKSGGWGFNEIFKIRGWMDYLHIESSMLICQAGRENIPFCKDKAASLNVDIRVVPDLKDISKSLKELMPKVIENTTEEDTAFWRFSYWLQRKINESLVHKKKSIAGKECYKALAKYYDEINNGIFFTENIIQRITKLYQVFGEYPHITQKVAHEIKGDKFDDDYDQIPEDIYAQTFFECKNNDVQTSLLIEHRARLAILKSAVDYLLFNRAGEVGKTENVRQMVFGLEFNLMDGLPNSFRSGMEELSTHKYFHRYPVFWQWFLWVFGGFILKDFKDKEYEVLAEKTGIPVEEIPNAFRSYEILFPTEHGWFWDMSPQSHIIAMKMFPVPVMGIGANYRRLIHAPKDAKRALEFDDLTLNGQWTSNDLIKWNNLLIDVLSK